MPIKWKIFFALNFILSLPALVCFIFLFINLIDSYNRSSDYAIAALTLISLLVITMNGFLNIYILQRFFPDKLVPEGTRRLNTISIVINGIVAAGILLLCIYAASVEFSGSYETRDVAGEIALAILFLLWIVQVVVLIMQSQLPGLINRNNGKKMRSMIDSIGR